MEGILINHPYLCTFDGYTWFSPRLKNLANKGSYDFVLDFFIVFKIFCIFVENIIKCSVEYERRMDI